MRIVFIDKYLGKIYEAEIFTDKTKSGDRIKIGDYLYDCIGVMYHKDNIELVKEIHLRRVNVIEEILNYDKD